MRTRLARFVTLLGACLCAACGNTTNGGGGSGAIYCGIGGTCPSGFACNANNFCIPSASDASGGDAAGLDAQAQDSGTGDSSVADSAVGDSGPKDTGPADAGPTDTGPSDTGPTDTGPAFFSVSALQQADSSQTCATPDGIATSLTDVQLETLIATSPGIKLKGSGGTYLTSFFAESAAPGNGQWTGVQVVVSADPFPVNVGDAIQFKGSVLEYFCMTELSAKPEDVLVTPGAGSPVGHPMLVSQFGDSGAEAYEGALITIQNVQVVDPAPLSTDGKSHGECIINHNGGAVSVHFAPALGSSYLTTGSTGTVTTLSAGQGIQSVTGNLQWSFGHWVIRLRSDADLLLK